jgi:hypothetical protein
MNTKVRKLVPSRKPTAFGPAAALSRSSGSGSSSGDSALVSMTRNSTSRAAPTASMATVRGAAQPTYGAWEMA